MTVLIYKWWGWKCLWHEIDDDLKQGKVKYVQVPIPLIQNDVSLSQTHLHHHPSYASSTSHHHHHHHQWRYIHQQSRSFHSEYHPLHTQSKQQHAQHKEQHPQHHHLAEGSLSAWLLNSRILLFIVAPNPPVSYLRWRMRWATHRSLISSCVIRACSSKRQTFIAGTDWNS